MRLKRLELQGYKSFATRTEFVFPTGITAIVGPNGSGKSNVADAIRWALGEQSLRMLRGKTTEDMIFSGGQRRARAGMAQVLLTLDNSDEWLPLDFSEVTIGRRAYRSGESEYLLNGNRVRLRDLIDLLAESGLAQRTYTVIGQGLVDAALSLQPQERRALFEEAAGIAVYRVRREEAASRLEETGRNLERVRDLLSDVAPRLQRLEEQAARFQEHERVSAHLRRLQKAWYGYHWGQAQEALRAALERAQSLETALIVRQEEAEEVAARLADLRQQQTLLRASLRDAYRRTADLHEQADMAQRELAVLAERVRLLSIRQEELAGELEPLLAQQDQQQERVNAAQARLQELQSQVLAQERGVEVLEEELNGLRLQAEAQASRRMQMEGELQALRARREALEGAVADARALEARLEAELELLSHLRRTEDGTSRGTRAVLQAGLPGVEGLLSQMIRVPQEWERAVEAALGPRLQAVVVLDWQAVAEVRSALQPDERVVLLPLSPPPPPRAGGQEDGRWLVAADVVASDPRPRPLVESLLGATVLVDDLEQARSLLPRLGPGAQCVTPLGEVVAYDGTVAVGTGSSGLLGRERSWRELPERLRAARLERERLETEASRMAQSIALLQQALQQAGQESAQASSRLAEAESGLLGQARTDLALARQALETQRAFLSQEATVLERLNGQVSGCRAQIEDLVAQRAAAQQRAAGLREETARLERDLAQVRSSLGWAEEALNRLAQEQEQAENQQRQVGLRLRQAEERLGGARLEVARCQDRLARLQERIQEDLGLVRLEVGDQVTAQTPLPLEPLVSPLPTVEALPEGLEEEVQRLRAHLRQLGPVNPNAPQEYSETQERYRFLSEQVRDLEATTSRLHGVIADLDQMMEQAFRETFEAAAAAFEETFSRLFGGGSARLELTDPGNLAHTGVDIVARPPGKRMQSLALLSGGERALVAAALIFAILRVRPTPFCVLDEVDAMLDEVNVARFRALLEELSNQTQFIVITHNRGTVEAADTVYGVSMGSEGVSQVISLRLDEQGSERG